MSIVKSSRATLAAIATTAIMLAAPASAGVFTYDTTIGNGIGDATLVINGDTGTATYSGANVDLTLTGSEFQGFDGDLSSATTLRADDINGTFTRNGTTYQADFSTTPKRTLIQLTDASNFLWTYGIDDAGNTFDFDGKGGLTLTSSCQTNCGGSDNGGSDNGGSDNGGSGQVPAPGPLGLIAAMALFGAWRRKRAIES